ncbi:hypothetical protein [Sphingomonas sp. CROZ-RG-20F-R02-07]|uniref:hypothetical protein n=1 Tax=Sphingomonas sp. CROZ-RG-20F-R02-07 TaxID=2914832 RepID=UPI001F5A5BE6|nr:hypothetical protein [Sphingomonas sp. CROZ-RG-20F-R02-07]
MKTFTIHCEYPAHYSTELTVEAEDLVGACRAAIDASHTTDGWKSLDTEHPTYVTAIAEGAGTDPWRFVPDGDDISVLPVPRLFSNVAACAGYAATRSEDLVDQLHIMIDAIGADGGLRITPAAMVRLCTTGQAILDDIATFGLSPTVPKAAASVVPAAPDGLPPEECGTWAVARPPQPQKSGPSCRCAAARSTPVFAVSLRCAPVRGPLIRPPRRCASGG